MQIYGTLSSRANRCLWMLEEIGEPYELVETSAHPDDLRTAAYLRFNPTARIPTLVDGDLVVWESLAINLYLAQKYEGPIHAGSPEVLAQATQWSIWAVLELEALAMDLWHHRELLVEIAREASHAERDELLLQKPLGVLNEVLDERAYLLGNDFTVADLNVAAIVRWVKLAGLDFTAVPEVGRWLDDCLARPALGRVFDTKS